MKVSRISTVLFLLLLSQTKELWSWSQFVDESLVPVMRSLHVQQVNVNDNRFIIEIAIFCDKDFGSIFSFDRNKIQEYWQALFWDVHMRYKTLQQINISFHITSITVLENAGEQPFIEAVRTSEGKVPLWGVFDGFQKWLYTQQVQSYDIGIAAVGAEIDDRLAGCTRLGGICLVNHLEQLVLSSLVMSIRTLDPVRVVAHEIAHLLGSPHDNEEDYQKYNCGTFNSSHHYEYIMGNGWDMLNNNMYFFSRCTNNAIVNFMKTLQAHPCLDQVMTASPLINTDETFKNRASSLSSISTGRQCQIVFNDTQAYDKYNNTLCQATLCLLDIHSENNNETRTLPYRPIDGSQCGVVDNNGVSKHCFRGLCKPPGIRLANTNLGYCLGAVNPLGSGVSVSTVMYDFYSQSNFPWDVINIMEVEPNNLMIYSSALKNETSLKYKCLMIREEIEMEGIAFVAKFEECSSNSYFRWEIIWLGENSDSEIKNKFLLKHKDTQRCLMTGESSNKVLGGTDCFGMDSRTKWKLVAENGSLINERNSGRYIEKADIRKQESMSSIRFYFDLVVVPLGLIKIMKFVFDKTRQFISYLRNCFKKTEENDSEVKEVKVD